MTTVPETLSAWLALALESGGDRMALNGEDRSFCYRELDHLSRRVAGALLARGAGPGQLVALCAEKNADSICAILGILRIGAAYVAIDPALPPARREQLLQIAGHPFTISADGAGPLSLSAALSAEPAAFLPAPRATDPAYVLFTSGTTGTPKAVEISQSAALAFARWAAGTVNLSPDDSVLSTSSLNFDLSTFDLFSTVGSGARLVLAPKAIVTFPSLLADLMEKEEIRVWYSVPSTIRLLADHGRLEIRNWRLRALLSAGDRFPLEAALRIRERTRCRLFNFYGPTETNVCLSFELPAEFRSGQEVPLGAPAAADECRILLSDRSITESGSGELIVAGPTVMSGYLSESGVGFLEHHGKKYYLTGDLVQREEHGLYFLIGRRDGLVKCWGHRVHPAEAEKILETIPGVRECAVVAVPHAQAGHLLQAAVVPQDGASIDGDVLLAELRGRLPSAAVPARLLILETLPRTPNGKTDRASLVSLFTNEN